jgi:8-oxo-dGTP diphosphatase
MVQAEGPPDHLPTERPMQLHLIRHAHAGSRSAWDGPDDERPLSGRGRRQATALATELDGEQIDVLWTSPFLRCRQTLEPLAAGRGLTITDSAAVAEGAAGPAALDACLAVAEDGRVLAMCSHGDVIPAMVAAAVRRGAELVGPRALTKGARYVCTVADGQITHISHVPAPDGH